MSYRDQVIARNPVLYDVVREHSAEREYWLDIAWRQERCGEDAAAAKQQAAMHEIVLRQVKRVAREQRSARTVGDVWDTAQEDAISRLMELERERRV